MRKNFNDPQFLVRLILGVLLAANLVAVGLVLALPDFLTRFLAWIQNK